MINSSPRPDIVISQVERSEPWFQSFHYMARLVVNESSCLRRLEHEYIDRAIKVRRQWGRKLRPAHPGSWAHAWEPLLITDDEVSTLHHLCDFFQKNSAACRITVGWNTIYFYTNDFSLIEYLYDQPYLAGAVRVQQVELKGHPGSVLLAQSDYQYRSFMRSTRLSDESSTALQRFLAAQTDIRLGPAFEQWTRFGKRQIREHYFIDHNSMSTPVMLALISPNLVRKTMSIVTDK